MKLAAKLTPRRAMAQPQPAPTAAPHPIPVAPDPTGDTATRNVDQQRRALNELAATVPAKLRPAHL